MICRQDEGPCLLAEAEIDREVSPKFYRVGDTVANSHTLLVANRDFIGCDLP